MKLSKQQIKRHKEAEAILAKDVLTFNEKCFVFENWFPAYGNQIGEISSFFTPIGLARDFNLEIGGTRIIDLCAGIGILTFTYIHRMKAWENTDVEVVCIERNPMFVEVGKKLLPEATWICADALDESIYQGLGHFDCAVSNPPFGKVKCDTDSKWTGYSNSEFEYKIIAIGSKIAEYGAYIIPSMSAPFEYSGKQCFRVRLNQKYETFYKQTGIVLNAGVGIDCDYYIEDWKGAAPKVEIVTVNKIEPANYSPKDVTEPEIINLPNDNNAQLDLFGQCA